MSMKAGFAFLTALFAGTTSALAAEDDLTTLFQREHAYLVAQKDELQRQIGDSRRSHEARLRSAESELKQLEARLARATVENDGFLEDVQRMEKERRDLRSRESALAALYKKAARELDGFEAALRFEPPAEEAEPTVPEQLDVSGFQGIRDRSIQALSTATETGETRAHYRDLDGKLTEGPVRRFGAIGAQALMDGEARVLGPSEDGVLTALEETSGRSSPLVGLYVFEQLKERASVRKAPRWIDQLASLTPGLLLAGLFAMVGGLFTVLIRE